MRLMRGNLGYPFGSGVERFTLADDHWRRQETPSYFYQSDHGTHYWSSWHAYHWGTAASYAKIAISSQSNKKEGGEIGIVSSLSTDLRSNHPPYNVVIAEDVNNLGCW